MDENATNRENTELSEAPQKADDSGDKKTGESRKKGGDTKMGLTLRALVAAYVLYLAYGLIQGFGETTGNDRIFIAAAIVIFVAAGGAILLLSVKKLIKKEYVDTAGQTEKEKQEGM